MGRVLEFKRLGSQDYGVYDVLTDDAYERNQMRIGLAELKAEKFSARCQSAPDEIVSAAASVVYRFWLT